jgi:hypothetical protein
VKRKRFGLSGIVAFLFLAGLVLVFYKWPSFLDANGTETTASVTEKRETVRANFGHWFRRFEIVAAFHASGSPLERHAVCDVEQATYDSFRDGDHVTAHYLPALLQQPFIPATHLAPCTPGANFGSNPDLYRKMEVIFGSLFAILFVWLLLRVRIAAWLLIPWFGFFLAYGLSPRAEPPPSRPRPAKATVMSVPTIVTILGGGTNAKAYNVEVKLEHPYQLARLQFTPPGATGPVVALDTVDLNSIANLAPKQVVDIDYDATNPRIARIHGGTRDFPTQALHQLMLTYAVMAGLFVALVMVSRLRRFRRRPRVV